VFGLQVGTGLLMREAAAAQQCHEPGQRVAPVPLDRQDRGQHRLRPSAPEVQEMGELERQDLMRMVVQDMVPHRHRSVRIAIEPVLQRPDMRRFLRGRHRSHPGCLRSVPAGFAA